MAIKPEELDYAKIYLEDRYVRSIKNKKIDPVYNLSYFERLYLNDSDPWNCSTSVYHQKKFSDTLALLPRPTYNEVLDAGCGNGIFTSLISERAHQVLGIDFSKKAAQLARERCESLANVSIQNCDLLKMPPKQQCDLIVCSELLYYLSKPKSNKELARKILVELLSPSGHLVIVTALFVDDWEKYLEEDKRLIVLKQKAFDFPPHRPYRITIFEKSGLTTENGFGSA